MKAKQLSGVSKPQELLKKLGVDGGGIQILSSKMKHHIIYISDLHVGGANILKQDALSIGADLAVPRGTVLATTKTVDCILIATEKELKILSKKELLQPFGLKELAYRLKDILAIKREKTTEIMGIINANDDSFFNGSRFQGISAINKIESMLDEGADIIDIGAVSSRPNASKVSVMDELSRVKPILDEIKKNSLYKEKKFSIDSYEPQVIEYALDSGFTIVNDITGFQNDTISKLTAKYDATAIIMHMQGTPQTMQNSPKYQDIVTDIYSFLENSISRVESFGVKDIVVDVGIGFGKTLEHNIDLIKNLENFLRLEKRVLVGASRKSMIDAITPTQTEDRLAGTLAIHLEAVRNGASILRVHDVKEHFQALRVYEALK